MKLKWLGELLVGDLNRTNIMLWILAFWIIFFGFSMDLTILLLLGLIFLIMARLYPFLPKRFREKYFG